MFKDVFFNKENKDGFLNRIISVLISVFFHLAIIVIVYLGPLLNSNIKLPELKVVDVYLLHVTPQLSKSMRVMKKISQKMSKLVNKKKIDEKFSESKEVLIAPIQIPDEIIEEEDELIIKDIEFGSSGGLEEGIEGGFDDGIVGGSLLGQTPVFISQPRRIKYVKPVYPPAALNARIGAAVIIEAITDVFGRVVNWKIISGHLLFNFAAIEAIKQWEYDPYIIKGIPKPVAFKVIINFMPFISFTDIEENKRNDKN